MRHPHLILNSRIGVALNKRFPFEIIELSLSFSFDFNPEEINRISHSHVPISIVKQTSFNTEFKQIIVALPPLRSSSTSTMHTKAYRMLINPNKTMGKKAMCFVANI